MAQNEGWNFMSCFGRIQNSFDLFPALVTREPFFYGARRKHADFFDCILRAHWVIKADTEEIRCESCGSKCGSPWGKFGVSWLCWFFMVELVSSEFNVMKGLKSNWKFELNARRSHDDFRIQWIERFYLVKYCGLNAKFVEIFSWWALAGPKSYKR